MYSLLLETYIKDSKEKDRLFNVVALFQEMYSLLLETYIKDSKEKDRLFNAIENIPCMLKRPNGHQIGYRALIVLPRVLWHSLVLRGSSLGGSAATKVDDSSKTIEFPSTLEFYKLVCEPELKPFIGQTFQTLEEACGFGVRHNTKRKTKEGSAKLKYIVCNGEGFYETTNQVPGSATASSHYTPAQDDREKKKRNKKIKCRRISSRCGCIARIGYKCT